MGLRTHEIVIGGRTIYAQLKKAEVSIVAHKLSEPVNVRQYTHQLCGELGGEEYGMIQWLPFGKGYELADEEGYKSDLAQYIAGLPTLVTYANLAEVLKQAQDLFDKYVRVEDTRKTPEERKAQNEEMKRVYAESARKAAERDKAKETEAEALQKQHPHLIPGDDLITGAKNIRIELARQWPGVKFSVKSQRFAGGNSISVSWHDGPTSKQVDELIKKYQHGSFDGMTDSYNYDSSTWCRAFGSAKYVSAERHESQAHITRAAAALGYTLEPNDFGEYGNIIAEGRDTQQRIYDHARKLPGDVLKPKPLPAIAPLAGVTVTENEEKDGIEIHFPAHPGEEVIDLLKANKWRWSRWGKCWYNKRNPDNRAFAEKFVK